MPMVTNMGRGYFVPPNLSDNKGFCHLVWEIKCDNRMTEGYNTNSFHKYINISLKTKSHFKYALTCEYIADRHVQIIMTLTFTLGHADINNIIQKYIHDDNYLLVYAPSSI